MGRASSSNGPTYVGMNRTVQACVNSWTGMPHVCGDEPSIAQLIRELILYAPRMWG